MTTFLLAGLAGLVALFVLVGLALPRRIHIERSALIEAAPDAIYPLVASFSAGWIRWSPFAEPGKTITFDGPESGVGATQRWDGGRSSIAITEANVASGIAYRLEHGCWRSTGRIAFVREAGATRVTWSDDAELSASPFVRWMGLVAPRVLGARFERGLATLEQHAEGGRAVAGARP